MSTQLAWAAPVLDGARLLGLFDTEGGEALIRFDTPQHGHVLVITARVDGQVRNDATNGADLGTVHEVLDTPDGVGLAGDFGWIVFPGGARIRMLDHWSGSVDARPSVAGDTSPELRVIGAILRRPETQVRVRRTRPDGRSVETVLTARGALGCAHGHAGDGEHPEVVLFASDDLTVRTLEYAGLLIHETVAGDVPDEFDPTGSAVTVQVINAPDDQGVITGGVFTWLECGWNGWVQLVEDGRRQPVPARTVARALVDALVPTAPGTSYDSGQEPIP